ncbi:hypothetical protein NDU88_002423 [Pleurodeles waltl]|uniref:Uncharacterized protein n=1 Tax=Pleurodeles waltl TaxID=8319 RepID=A0AAV7P903_PLEWA|nr:hypothetical protein NDU88_002423 [Pleurodeles waltl]
MARHYRPPVQPSSFLLQGIRHTSKSHGRRSVTTATALHCSQELLSESFTEKCGISNALDGEEDKLIYEDSSSESSSVQFEDIEDSSEDEEFLGFPDSDF